jgi:hypothetical protein
MKEKDFQIKFGHWLRNSNFSATAAFELKICKSKSLSFNAVKEHQVNALYLAKNRKLFYKIPDEGLSLKPFDCIILNGAQAYVVVQFYARGQREFVMIDVDSWIAEIRESTRRSLTESRAKEIGDVFLL